MASPRRSWMETGPVPSAVHVRVYDFPASTGLGALLKAMAASADEAIMATETIDRNNMLTEVEMCGVGGE